MHLGSPCHLLLGRHIGLYSVRQSPAIAVAILHINKHGYRNRDIRGELGPGQGLLQFFMGVGRRFAPSRLRGREAGSCICSVYIVYNKTRIK